MRLGLIAQPHLTGISIQTWEFARAMNPEKVLITDLSSLHAKAGKEVSRKPWFEEWDHRYCEIPRGSDMDWLTDGVDAVFVVETPLNHMLWEICRRKGVVGVEQPNYEFFDPFLFPHYPLPDYLAIPTNWGADHMRSLVPGRVISVPVSDRITRRVIEEANTFVHVAGHKTYADRNGTDIVREATRYIQSDALVKIHYIDGTVEYFRKNDGWSVDREDEVENYWDLYSEGDCLLMPRRYGGLSLVVQEAAQSGMAILTGKHDPYCLMGVSYGVTSTPGPSLKLRTIIPTHDVSPKALALGIDELRTSRVFRHQATKATQFADSISWKVMKDEYDQMFEDVCSSL